MRLAGYSLIALLTLFLPPSEGRAGDLRIAAWNLEHLADTEGKGCVGRTRADYDALARRVEELDADIVAFQEVENEAAAHRVFPASDWHVEMSGRPPMRNSRACWDRPEARLGHLATGFAIRRGVTYRRNADLRALGGEQVFQRWGTDISVVADGRELRLLSVHLRTGCWGKRQDRHPASGDACAMLRAQVDRLGAWVDARGAERAAFVVMGDFNRRMALRDDWGWAALSPPSRPLVLLTEGVPSRCDPRFPAFIDHLVAGGGAGEMLVEGSFREWPREGPHPDHCALSADLRTAR